MTTDSHALTLQDFVFGGIETDDQRRLATERARWTGIRHEHHIDPLDPQPHAPVTLTVTVAPDVHVDRVTAYVTTDGRDPTGGRGAASSGFAVALEPMETRWEPLIWDYVEVWQGQIPGQPAGTSVHYRIEGWHSQDVGTSIWSREQNLEHTPERPALYGYSVDRYTTPPWAHEAVIYHVLVDRFARGPRGEAVKDDWLEPKEMETFVGGDLPGVTARLDYIADLGATALWLSPIFAAASYHGYDTVDFWAIDARFGTAEDLRKLVEKAHRLGLRLILDFVANHTSDRSPIFQEALGDPNSPYRAWFHFGAEHRHGYRCFFDVATMPQFDTDNRQVRQYLIGAASHWLRAYDVDGYRLDYAAGPGHSFWSEFRAACKAVKPDCWLCGEVTRAGDALRTYVGRLDGCLDFNFLRRVRQLCAGPGPAIPLNRFVTHLERSRRFFPADFVLPAFLDNHDTNRFLWMADNDTARLRLALGLLFACGGAPILYYGTEVGLSQPRPKGPYREESRHSMLWDGRQDTGLLDYTRRLIRQRREHPALVHGTFVTHFLDDARGLWLVERRHGADRVWIAVNLGPRAQTIHRPGRAFVDLLNETPTPGTSLRLSPRSVTFLTESSIDSDFPGNSKFPGKLEGNIWTVT